MFRLSWILLSEVQRIYEGILPKLFAQLEVGFSAVTREHHLPVGIALCEGDTTLLGQCCLRERNVAKAGKEPGSSN